MGVDAIDDQHKTWIEHYNGGVEAIESRLGPAPVTRTLGFLIDYTDVHFSTEEGFMSRTGYPGLETHVAKHEELRAPSPTSSATLRRRARRTRWAAPSTPSSATG